MPSYTVCGSTDCPLRTGCRRSPDSGTEPSPWSQSWATFEWIEPRRGEVVCDGLRPVRQETAAAPRQFDQGRP